MQTLHGKALPLQISNNGPITTEHSPQDGSPVTHMKAAHWHMKLKMLDNLGFSAQLLHCEAHRGCPLDFSADGAA